jgi:nucleoside-diphosphate-sugar epimerase
MIQAVARGRFPSLPDTGNKRSMVDVRDVIQAAVLAATNPVGAGKVYIVTDGQAYSTRQIYEWICTTVQRPVSRMVIPLPLLRTAGLIGDIISRLRGRRIAFNSEALNRILRSSWYSSEKICRELNFQPKHSLKSSLPDIAANLIRI